MDIPVMPHPGTDTQASPYQSRQTKEPVSHRETTLHPLAKAIFLGKPSDHRSSGGFASKIGFASAIGASSIAFGSRDL